MNSITIDKAMQAMQNKGLETLIIKAGESPYSSFDLLAMPAGHDWQGTPSTWTVSPVQILSTDPATAYKGRHGKGRLILVQPSQGGWRVVTSQDKVELVLANDTQIGTEKSIAFGDLFAGIEL